jgi:hypothetical protein
VPRKSVSPIPRASRPRQGLLPVGMATSHCSVGVAVDAVPAMVAEVTVSRPKPFLSLSFNLSLSLFLFFLSLSLLCDASADVSRLSARESPSSSFSPPGEPAHPRPPVHAITDGGAFVRSLSLSLSLFLCLFSDSFA